MSLLRGNCPQAVENYVGVNSCTQGKAQMVTLYAISFVAGVRIACITLVWATTVEKKQKNDKNKARYMQLWYSLFT